MKKESIPNAFTMFIGKSIISDDTSFRRSRAGTVGGKARSKNLNGDGIQNVHQLKVNSKLTERQKALSLIPWGTKKEQAERRVQQSIESKRSQQAADKGLARELVYSYKWQAEKAPQWFRGVMDKLAKKYGQKYADDIRALMTLEKNRK